MYYMCTKFEVITQVQRIVKVMDTHFYHFWHRNHSDSYHSNQNINFLSCLHFSMGCVTCVPSLKLFHNAM